MNQTVSVESRFFTSDGQYYGTNRLPFEIMSLVEMSGCNRVCYGDVAQSGAPSQPDRCISAAGLDSGLNVVVKAYCLPASLKTGFRPSATVTDGSFPNAIDYSVPGSSAWSAAIMRLQYVSVSLVDSVGHSNILAVATASNVSLISDQRQSYTLLQTIPSAQKAVLLTDVYSIDEMVTFPDDGTADIFVRATTTAWDASGTPSTGPVCLHIAVDTKKFATLAALKSSAYTIRRCAGSVNVFSAVQTPYVTCLGPSCSGVALFPTDDGAPVSVCDRAGGVLSCVQAASDAHLASDLGLNTKPTPQITLTQDNLFIRQSPKLAQSSLSGWNGAGQQSSMTIFAVADQKVTTTWLADVRLNVAAGAWNGTRSYSSSYQMLTTLKKNCSVSDCTGCMGYPTLQSLCYAASQCAVARCIGTEVNFQRPLCAIGSMASKVMRQSLLTLQNVYLIFAQSMALIVDASTGQITNRVVIEWPDQVFFSAMCDMKDITVSAVGVLMSLVNGITMKTQEVLSTVSAGLVPTDPSFNARATLSMASMTNLFSQILLLPLYAAVAGQKTFVCTTNSLTAILNTDLTGNFQLVIGDPSIQAVSGDVAGVCLTQVFQQDVQNQALGGSSNSLNNAVAQVSNRLIGAGFTLELAPAYHMVDAMLAYASGVTYGFMDVLQTIDQKHCKLPDVTTETMYRCACGDYAHRISTARRNEGIKQQAFWCTGSLQLLGTDGKPYLVFNPYTLEELASASRVSMSQYLTCVGTGGSNCQALKPSLPYLERQGVDPGTVLTRCRSNYVNKVWDSGAAYLVNYLAYSDLAGVGYLINQFYQPSFVPSSVLTCLVQSLALGTGNDACLLGWLTLMNVSRTNYFRYDVVGFVSDNADFADIDGCEVFTGPAQNPDPAVAYEFGQCLNSSTASQCQLPYYIWSGRTSNRVPVASLHAVSYPPGSSTLLAAAASDQLAILREAEGFFTDTLLKWSNPSLQASFFSVEGDVLHQFFDCYFMGPFASAELWPSGGSRSLGTMLYYRNSPTDRTFMVPSASCKPGVDACCPQESPFSCGGPARMAIVHGFIDKLRSSPGSATNSILANAVQEGVRAKLREFKDIFTNLANYACACPDGSNRVDCCTAANPGGWSSPEMQAIDYSILSSEDVLDTIFDLILQYIDEDVYFNRTLFGTYAPALTSAQTAQGRDEALFGPFEPVSTYGESEVLDARKNHSLWDVCVNLVSQTFATLPLDPTLSSFATASGAGTFQYDPVASPSSALFVDQIEETVSNILGKAKLDSPFYWGVAGGELRYMPSYSMRCRTRGARVAPVTNKTLASDRGPQIPLAFGSTYAVSGYLATLSLPAYGPQGQNVSAFTQRCYCGWTTPDGSLCRIDPLVCATANLQSLTTVAAGTIKAFQAICTAGSYITFDDWVTVYRVMDATWSSAWTCPDMQLSDIWGVVNDLQIDYWAAAISDSIAGEGLVSAGAALGGREYCDAVLDYWPSDWIHPSGYHVSTGCTHDETAFRAFDTWMSVDYERLRNDTLLRNYFGGAATCSGASYGMPMFGTNNARLQARWRDGQTYDPTQPVGATVPPGAGTYTQTLAAGSWTQVPTRGRLGDTPAPSSGLLYLWVPGMASAALVWPMAGQDLTLYELPEGTAPAWGPQCGQLPLKTCLNDTDCGSVNGAKLVCLRSWSESQQAPRDGVCAIQGVEPLECYQNYHCEGKGQVCGANGRCVDGRLLMRNRVGYSAEFHAHSEQCPVESLGYSPWQNVSDFLSRHGMCGFRDWFEYSDMLRRGANTSAFPGQLVGLDPRALWYSTSPYVAASEVRKSLFDREILKVHPHTCDRDYAYLLPSCATNPSSVLGTAGSPVPSPSQGETMRTWRRSASGSGWELDMCMQDHLPRERTGFLYPYLSLLAGLQGV
ncbi:hypothetical protein GUITHDRAFT_121790 [Guillardia theta CCMP2712]|uniref:Uncharacterized protein n=1 Tax=Guillardia theta (strain CCMP2712) TaxID=905079 RepID=L1I707_GUITC|nr:hypothetical protein GUITHDRAFT_121790 [Guillardia theta CCMP2712]EKX32043.1 hypothetical protein GUITHDRAFT_121790 [Guillardia theta CCMP2712]|eukprot:XP_005819023.1 hypothetical protein GUITHDRAFT_121790 [Guillardia theta CCMP2712]